MVEDETARWAILGVPGPPVPEIPRPIPVDLRGVRDARRPGSGLRRVRTLLGGERRIEEAEVDTAKPGIDRVGLRMDPDTLRGGLRTGMRDAGRERAKSGRGGTGGAGLPEDVYTP